MPLAPDSTDPRACDSCRRVRGDVRHVAVTTVETSRSGYLCGGCIARERRDISVVEEFDE